MGEVAVVIPVRDAAGLLGECLTSIGAQAEDTGATIIVVDDASNDGSAAIARSSGAEVIQLSKPRGPYAARNMGWRHTNADVIVFTDARCRARPGWLVRSVDAIADGVAIAGADVWVRGGGGVASRAAHRQQPLLASRSVNDRYLPFVATCSLATTRPVLEAVDGFLDVQSGGDVDFCWRVQRAGLGGVTVAEGAAMDWDARRSLRALVGQYRRYGRNTGWLQSRYGPLGCPADPVVPRWRGWGGAARSALRSEPRSLDPRIVCADLLCRIAMYEGHRQTAGGIDGRST